MIGKGTNDGLHCLSLCYNLTLSHYPKEIAMTDENLAPIDHIFRIHSLIPVTGDWFILVRDYNGDGTSRWFIDRVVALAAGRTSSTIDHVCAIDSSGVPCEHDAADETHIVFGKDKSPIGKTWAEIYDSDTPGLTYGPKEFTSLMVAAGIEKPWEDTEEK